MHHGQSFAVASDSASRRDHSVQGQAGICKPATPKCHPLPDQNPYAKGERRPSTIKSKGKLQLILFVLWKMMTCGW